MRDDDADSWSVPQALVVAYEAFTQRFGADLLWQAFEALTVQHRATLREHAALDRDLGQYLDHALTARGAELVVLLANSRSEPQAALLLLHCGVRWWRARDDLLRRSGPKVRVPKVYAEGMNEHVSLQLLSQMLYRGAAPDTAAVGGDPSPTLPAPPGAAGPVPVARLRRSPRR